MLPQSKYRNGVDKPTYILLRGGPIYGYENPNLVWGLYTLPLWGVVALVGGVFIGGAEGVLFVQHKGVSASIY